MAIRDNLGNEKGIINALQNQIADINKAIPYTVIIDDDAQTIDFVDREFAANEGGGTGNNGGGSGSGNGGSNVRGNWNQNDENADDYIVGRTHYKMPDEVINWSGDTENATRVTEFDKETGEEDSVYPNGYYHVSDRVPTVEELKSGVITAIGKTGGEEQTETVPLLNVWSSVVITEKVYGFPIVLLVVTEDNYVFDNETSVMTFPKAGIYFYYEYGNEVDYVIVNNLTLPGGIKQLDDKFIPDTICRKEHVEQLLGASIEQIASLIGGDA